MAPPKFTPAQKKASALKVKQYQKEYHKNLPIELKRIYNKAYISKQLLKKTKKSV